MCKNNRTHIGSSSACQVDIAKWILEGTETGNSAVLPAWSTGWKALEIPLITSGDRLEYATTL